MTALTHRPAGYDLGAEVIEHLQVQIASARRLLATVLEQGAAVRAQDVERVLACVTELQTELGRRGRLEGERALLLHRAGSHLGVTAAEVTLERLAALLSPSQAAAARALSAELRGLLDEVGREHACNRALMRQELAFLEHLVRLLGAEPELGYGPTVAPPAALPAHRVLDLRA